MVDITKAGLLGLITILAAFGGSQYLVNVNIDITYVCELTEEIGIFDRLSASQKTGYYQEEGKEKRVSCRIGRTYGKWIPIKEYCEERGISVDSLINKEKIIKENGFPFEPGAKYECNQEGCKKIN